MSNRWIAALFIVALAPSTAAAQFTTFISPPNPLRDSIRAVVAAEQTAATDSVARAQIANMKTWVDSAAGIVVPPVDTTITTVTTTTTATATTDGLIAPNTASPVPFLLAVGIAGILLGLFMIRPRPTARRIDRK